MLHPVSRMPALAFVHTALISRQNVLASKVENNEEEFAFNIERTFYLLNPSGDLKNTQLEFEEYFKR